jgi:hypothetical protein
MQDVDLFKRRSEQKIDAQENQMYTRSQYINKKIDRLMMKPEDELTYSSKRKRIHSLDIMTDAEYAGLSSMVYSQPRPDLPATKKSEMGYVRLLFSEAAVVSGLIQLNF